MSDHDEAGWASTPEELETEATPARGPRAARLGQVVRDEKFAAEYLAAHRALAFAVHERADHGAEDNSSAELRHAIECLFAEVRAISCVLVDAGLCSRERLLEAAAEQMRATVRRWDPMTKQPDSE